MFFDHISQIPDIAKHTSCAIFVVPPDTDPGLAHALTLTPSESKKTTVIGVEQIRDFIALTNSRETKDRFFVITPADAMNEAAQNALLKTLEEPKEFCHFVLLTEQPGALLPTILSRAQIFFLKTANLLNQPLGVDNKTITKAKQLISANAADLPQIAADLAKQKDQAREQTLTIVATAIEILYRTYFQTGNIKFLTKIPKFLQLHEHLSQNGHLKLHIVTDLM